MVYYHTLANVKMIRNILNDYRSAIETTPYEYMTLFIKKCPDSIDESKLAWVSETFLGIQKHSTFLQEIVLHISEQLNKDDQEYFEIILYAVIFQIKPNDMQLLYKCLFILSKPLLDIFTMFLSNSEVLSYISQVSHSIYDSNYTTEKIIEPLFIWQPYISEMAHNYAEYVKKNEKRKQKLPTIPINPKVLNRKGKKILSLQALPETPANSVINKKCKMLTKSAIDLKLEQLREKNKQKAINLLNDVKNNDCHYALGKATKDAKLESESIENYNTGKPTFKTKRNIVIKNVQIPVKDNAATIKKLNYTIKKSEQEEVEWLEDLVNNFKNTHTIEELEEVDRREKEKKRLLDIEKKHLMGQISHEEAALARQKLQQDNKKKHEMFLNEKMKWDEEIERWKREELEKSKKLIEDLSLSELSILEAKSSIISRKKKEVEIFKKNLETIREKVMKEKKEELEKKMKMIKEIKILALVAKTAKVPKVIDLTESSNLGLMCEMSIAELQERLSAMKVGLKEELERKRNSIKEEKVAAKQELHTLKEKIKMYMNEKADLRKTNKKPLLVDHSSKEISELKKILEEKRKQRIKSTS